jgi:hypothetical protein
MDFEEEETIDRQYPEFEILEDWIDDTHWIHYHHSDDPRHFSDGFGDSPHHTGFWMSGLILLGEEDEFTADSFYNGYIIRVQPDGTLIRHPRTKDDLDRPVVINRDQITPLLYAVNYFHEEEARDLYERNKKNLVLLPLHRNFLYRSMGIKLNYLYRLFCDGLEIIDTLFDVFNLHVMASEYKNVFVIDGHGKHGINGTDSSIIKSYFRSVISRTRFPTFLARLNGWLLRKCINIPASFSRYFNYSHNDIDSPPPVHLIWFRVYERFN